MDKREFIASVAAKYFHASDVVNLGIGIPSLCASYSERGVLFQSENGFIGVGLRPHDLMINEGYFNAGGVPFIPAPGGAGFDVATSFGIIRSGRMAATVLGALQVSEKGDLCNWATQGRSFGMGGAMDLVNGAKKVIVAMEHCDKNGNPKILKECTLPYTGRNCVNHIVTELCVIDVTRKGLVLKELAAGHTVEEVQEKTEPTLIMAEEIKEMVPGVGEV